MPTPVNNRVFWPAQSVGVAPQSAPTTFSTIRGLQSVGLSAQLPIQFIFELGYGPSYDSYEETPEVEVSLEKVMDGYAPIHTLVTQGAATADLYGRAPRFCSLAVSIHRDNRSRADGGQVAQCTINKAYESSLSYGFTNQGPFRETVSLVSDNATWLTSTFTYTGHLSGNGVTDLAPTAPEGVNRRQHLKMSDCLFPANLPGIADTGLNANKNVELTIDGSTQFTVSFESIQVSVNLGRTGQTELGRKGVYCRYVEFPVAVTTTFEFRSKMGAHINLDAEAENTTEEPILLVLEEGLVLDLGTNNRLTSWSQTGGDAGAQGADQMLSFTYENQSDLIVQHPLDPTVALRP